MYYSHLTQHKNKRKTDCLLRAITPLATSDVFLLWRNAVMAGSSLKNIKMVWRDGLSHHFKPIGLFLGAAVDEKTAAQKTKKKSKISATPSQFFLNISQTTKARRLRFLAIDLTKHFAQNPSICLFLEPPATISAKSKTPKTVSLSGGSLVKSAQQIC